VGSNACEATIRKMSSDSSSGHVSVPMPDGGAEGVAAYEQSWTVAAARGFFADPGSGSRLNVVSDHHKADVRYREISFDIRPGVSGVATVVDAGRTAGPGVVLAHGGSDDGRRFLLTEAEQLARRGATVILPVTRFPWYADVDHIASAIRDAVLTERRAVGVLLDWAGSRPDNICFLGHSAGAFLAAHLSAVEPRLAKVVPFGYGAGTFLRLALREIQNDGDLVTNRILSALRWFEPGQFVAAPGDRRLFIQHGINDQEVPIAEGRALFDVAAAPKQWSEYPCGHDIDANIEARADRADFVFA